MHWHLTLLSKVRLLWIWIYLACGEVAGTVASKRPISFSSIHSSETISAPEGARDLNPCFSTHLMPLNYELQTSLVRCQDHRPTQVESRKATTHKKGQKSNTIEIHIATSRSKSRQARTEPLWQSKNTREREIK